MADAESRKGIGYITPEILGFLSECHAPHDDSLGRAFGTPGEHGIPAIQVGPLEGKLLSLLMRLVNAAKVVEVGTLTGYSALWLRRGMDPQGTLWTLECDPKHAAVAREIFSGDESPGARIKVLQGPARDSLNQLNKHSPFDAMFIDADKAGYPAYAEWAVQNLRPGGLLIADNTHYFGKLLDESEAAVAMRRFHHITAEHFDSVNIPTPDGLVLGIRRGDA